MRVSVMDLRKVIYKGNVREVTLPGEEEEITVLDFHQAFLCRLKEGIVQMRKPDNRLSINGGVARMYRNELTILVRT